MTKIGLTRLQLQDDFFVSVSASAVAAVLLLLLLLVYVLVVSPKAEKFLHCSVGIHAIVKLVKKHT